MTAHEADRFEGFPEGTRVRAVLAIVYVTARVEVAAGAEGIVVLNRPRGLYGLATVSWDTLDRALDTSVDCLERAR